MLDSRNRAALALILLALLTVFIYWPGLSGPLILDDVSNLEPLRILDRQGRLDFAHIMQDRGGWLDRPVSMLSFYFNWRLTGDDVWSLKLTNLLIHLACGILVYFLACCLLERTRNVRNKQVRWLALCVTGLWLLAPIQVSTVLYLIQRMAQLATLFSLTGLLCYCLGRNRIEQLPRQGMALILAAFLVCWPLATLSKENGALLPLLLLITEWFFYSSKRHDKVVLWIRAGLLLSVLIPAMLVLGYALAHPDWIDKFYFARGFSLPERLLTQPRVLLDYAANIVQLPGFSPLGFFHDDVIPSLSLLRPPTTLAAILVLVAIPALSLLYRNSEWGGVWYGLLFFVCAHLIEASVFPLEMYFEHRNYLPGFGLLFALTIGLYGLGGKLAMPRLLKLLLLTLLISYSGLSAARAWVWKSWRDIVQVAVVKHPNSVRAQAGAAIGYLLEGEINKAMPYLQREKELAGHRRDNAVSFKLLSGYCLAGVAVPAQVYATWSAAAGLKDNPAEVSALRWFQELVTSQQCGSTLNSKLIVAILERKSEALNGPGSYSHNWELHYYLGRLFKTWKRPALAYRNFKRAYRYAPQSRIQGIRAQLRTLQP